MGVYHGTRYFLCDLPVFVCKITQPGDYVVGAVTCSALLSSNCERLVYNRKLSCLNVLLPCLRTCVSNNDANF